MPEYIDRENYCKSICRCSRDKCDKDKCPLWAAPAADVEPVVHAEWRNNKNDYPECTNCGYMPAYDPAIDDIWYSPRCPKCGARMKNGEKLE